MAYFTTAELLRLAQILSEAQQVSLSTISRRATGGRNFKLFDQLLSGRGCNTLSLERAEAWLLANWPRYVLWPADIERPDLPPTRCAAE
jgi:hypothetical protein